MDAVTLCTQHNQATAMIASCAEWCKKTIRRNQNFDHRVSVCVRAVIDCVTSTSNESQIHYRNCLWVIESWIWLRFFFLRSFSFFLFLRLTQFYFCLCTQAYSRSLFHFRFIVSVNTSVRVHTLKILIANMLAFFHVLFSHLRSRRTSCKMFVCMSVCFRCCCVEQMLGSLHLKVSVCKCMRWNGRK